MENYEAKVKRGRKAKVEDERPKQNLEGEKTRCTVSLGYVLGC